MYRVHQHAVTPGIAGPGPDTGLQALQCQDHRIERSPGIAFAGIVHGQAEIRQFGLQVGAFEQDVSEDDVNPFTLATGQLILPARHVSVDDGALVQIGQARPT